MNRNILFIFYLTISEIQNEPVFFPGAVDQNSFCNVCGANQNNPFGSVQELNWGNYVNGAIIWGGNPGDLFSTV